MSDKEEHALYASKSNVTLDRGEGSEEDRGTVTVSLSRRGMAGLFSGIGVPVILPPGTIARDYLGAEKESMRTAAGILDEAALFLRKEAEK